MLALRDGRYHSAAARSVLAAVTIAMRSEYPMKAFSDLSAGLSWGSRYLEDIDGARLDAVALADHSAKAVRAGQDAARR